jgi:hypothetical protein
MLQPQHANLRNSRLRLQHGLAVRQRAEVLQRPVRRRWLLRRSRLSRRPVLQRRHEDVRLDGLRVHLELPVPRGPEVLRWHVHDRRVLYELRLSGR